MSHTSSTTAAAAAIAAALPDFGEKLNAPIPAGPELDDADDDA